MAYLRHTSRHLQQTIANHVQTILTNLLWIGPTTTTPFGAIPVTYQTSRPNEEELKSLSSNTVAISFGSEPDDVEDELGGGLLTVDHVFFVDCYMEKEALAVAIASDIKDTLSGRVPGTSRFLTVVNQATATPVLGYRVEFVDIIREPVQRDLARLHWQVVKATATLTYVGEE